MHETNQPTTHPRAAALRRLIAQASREPFQVVLADALDNAPSAAAWADFASRAPDKWASATRSLGELAGYSTRSETSAADILSELANLVEVLDRRSGGAGAALPPVLEAEVVDVEPEANVAQEPVYKEREATAPPAASPAIGADGWP